MQLVADFGIFYGFVEASFEQQFISCKLKPFGPDAV
jgi:hypothetical protein